MKVRDWIHLLRLKIPSTPQGKKALKIPGSTSRLTLNVKPHWVGPNLKLLLGDLGFRIVKYITLLQYKAPKLMLTFWVFLLPNRQTDPITWPPWQRKLYYNHLEVWRLEWVQIMWIFFPTLQKYCNKSKKKNRCTHLKTSQHTHRWAQPADGWLVCSLNATQVCFWEPRSAPISRMETAEITCKKKNPQLSVDEE